MSSSAKLKTDTSPNQDAQAEKWVDNPVLIYGSRKGGTTLLENLHDGNSCLFMHPHEMKLKTFIRGIWTSPEDSIEFYKQEATILKKDFAGFDYDGYRNSLDQNLSGAKNFADLLKKDIQAIHAHSEWKPATPKMWVVKEVGGFTRNILASWRMIMPFDSKMVLIIRDPLMVVRSIITNRRRKGVRISLLGLLKETREACRLLVQTLDYTDDPNAYFISYDELTDNPEKTMTGVCTFLGIPYEDINSRPTIFGKSVIVGSSSQNSNVVFKHNKKWDDDLTLREKLWVSICYKIFFSPKKLGMSKKAKSIKSYTDALTLVQNSTNRK